MGGSLSQVECVTLSALSTSGEPARVMTAASNTRRETIRRGCWELYVEHGDFLVLVAFGSPIVDQLFRIPRFLCSTVRRNCLFIDARMRDNIHPI